MRRLPFSNDVRKNTSGSCYCKDVRKTEERGEQKPSGKREKRGEQEKEGSKRFRAQAGEGDHVREKAFVRRQGGRQPGEGECDAGERERCVGALTGKKTKPGAASWFWVAENWWRFHRRRNRRKKETIAASSSSASLPPFPSFSSSSAASLPSLLPTLPPTPPSLPSMRPPPSPSLPFPPCVHRHGC